MTNPRKKRTRNPLKLFFTKYLCGPWKIKSYVDIAPAAEDDQLQCWESPQVDGGRAVILTAPVKNPPEPCREIQDLEAPSQMSQGAAAAQHIYNLFMVKNAL